MKIVNHKLADVPYRQAHSFGGEMVPTLICLHDTAGRLTPGSSVDWFTSEECNTSAHVVIERDGSITQQVPFTRKAWHCGPSRWKGREFCNSFAIGIEIVNPGLLDKDGRAWFHKKTERGFPTAGLKRVISKPHGGEGWWMDYTAEQIAAVTNLCKALRGSYPIEDISTHWAIAPGRKVDTNPLFPLEQVRQAVLMKPQVAAAEDDKAQTPTVVAGLMPVTPEGEEPREGSKWFAGAKFAQLNELAEQGSRTGGYIKRFKTWLHTLLWGGTATGGTVAMLVDPDKPAAAATSSWAAQHPILLAAICALAAALVVGALAWFFTKRIEAALVTAWKKGHHTPSGAAT